jgi:3-deoxy-D-manno-octulosonic acid kinase
MLSIERVERIGESAILYDASLVNHIPEAWFDRQHWPGAHAAPGQSGRRGATLFISCEGRDWVLKHYHRGGLVAHVADDGFTWSGEQRVRSFAEWRVLDRIRAARLPAPRPVAARYVRSGLLYRADLITERIPGVLPLSTRLGTGALGPGAWGQVGACIGRFHRARFFHADLNAHNIQLDERDGVFLLDFAGGRLMPGEGAGRQRNRRWWRRSLDKIRRDDRARFDGDDWAALLEGYEAALAGHG